MFPQSYTSVSPPEPADSAKDSAQLTGNGNGPHTPVESVVANSAQVDQTLANLTADSTTDGASIRSRTSRRDSDDDLPNANNHRAQLAARAVAEVAAQQKERNDQLTKRRQADEEAYELARQKGLIDGLQLSDESDVDDVADGHFPTKNPAAPPSIVKAASPKPSELSLPTVSPTLSASAAGGAPLSKQRSRADTIASNYAESTYSAPGSPPVPLLPASINSDAIADFQALAAEPATHYSTLVDDQTEELSPDLAKTPSAPTKFEKAQTEPLAKTQAESEVQSTVVESSSSSLKPAEAIEAVIGAGVAGIAAAAVAATSSIIPHAEDNKDKDFDAVSEEATPTAVAQPTESVTGLAAAAPIHPGSTAPYTNGHTNGSLSTATLDLPAPSSVGARSLVTPPPLDMRTSTLSGLAPSASSPSASITSSGFRPGSSAGPIDPSLPYDPRTWGVDEVVNWANGRGFDSLTVSKFKEHEISGDVLLELDVALLKEIDLPAFGRRVHIYNAIKELKARVAVPSTHSTRPGSILSPSTSGYEPDSPATTLSYATPLQGNFISPAPNFANFGAYNGHHAGSSATGSQDGDVQGLGFEDSRPGSAASQVIKPMRSRSALSASGGHTRSATLNTTSSNGLDSKIAEEVEEIDGSTAEPTTPEARPPRLRKASTRMSIHRGKQSGDDLSGSSSPSSPSVPVVPAGGKTPKMDRSSFFGATIGRSRKPPPKVPSTLSLDTLANGGGAVARPRSSVQSNTSKRTTRLFSSFGSAGDKSPVVGNRRSMMSPSMTPKERDGPSSMSAKAVDAATSEMLPKQLAAVKAGDLMEKLGRPDYSGWMNKKGEKYNGWKQRFLVLKGIHLYWLKSESEQRVKGFINLTGYRVISDPDIHPGEFGFKIVHDSDRAHHFSAAEQVTVRNWMKEIMKATIGRDYAAPVVSSCEIDTLPLKIAQTMNPRPRPPSPTERAQIQKERYAGTNPNTLSAKDAQILMEFAPGSPLMTSPPLGTNSPSLGQGSRLSMMGLPKGSTSPLQSSSLVKSLHVDDLAAASGGTTPGDKTPTPARSAAKPAPAPVATAVPVVKQGNTVLLEWVNDHLPLSVGQVSDLGTSLRSGKVLTRLLEELSGQPSGISDADFGAYREPGAGGDFDAAYFDCVFNGQCWSA